jgi:hypothetical protein
LEMVNIRQFIQTMDILIEKYGEPVYPAFTDDKKIFDEFKRHRQTNVPRLTDWCVRYELNKVEMVNKDVNMNELVIAISHQFPNIHVVYSDSNDATLVMRVYFHYDDSIDFPYVRDMGNEIIDTTIRGITGLRNFEVIQINRSFEDEKTGELVSRNVYAISCDGSNIPECFSFADQIDVEHIISDSVMDVYETYGIEVARMKLSDEMRSLMDTYDVCPFHCELLAQQFCRLGTVGNIGAPSLAVREPNNPMLTMIYRDVMANLRRTALNAKPHKMIGGAANFVFGQMPQFGTMMNKLIVNEEMFKTNLNDLLDEI